MIGNPTKVRDVTCPTCHAAPGQPCYYGFDRARHHDERWKVAAHTPTHTLTHDHALAYLTPETP